MSVVYVEMENVLKINAGIACLDRTNEVEPRPNGVILKKKVITTNILLTKRKKDC
ncbi:MAG: hypothetical protein LBG80_03405 [Bacteroidales bacterium]|jgi:hypothetical protein|nr:hypothetical protein [Bacteroidales bacterium]